MIKFFGYILLSKEFMLHLLGILIVLIGLTIWSNITPSNNITSEDTSITNAITIYQSHGKIIKTIVR